MLKSEHYDLNLVEGTDIVNPLVIDRPNYEKIDVEMYKNAQTGIQTATELYDSGLKVHALTLSKPSSVFRFVATSAYASGDTFTLNGTQVTALLPSGETLSSGAYVINSTVLCALNGTVLTLFLGSGTVALASNADRLGGELPDYYATAVQVQAANALAESAVTVANQTAASVGMDIIWRNPNVQQDFPATTIPVNLNAYRIVKIVFRLTTAIPRVAILDIPVNAGWTSDIVDNAIENTNRIYQRSRSITIGVNKEGIEIYSGHEKLTSPYAENLSASSVMIPVTIYGIK